MTNKQTSRRTFVRGIAALTVTSAHARNTTPEPDVSGAQKFVSAWDKAWANHDPVALGALHTETAVTVNRFGTLLQGRAPIQEALAFLHQKNGPFSHAKFSPQEIVAVRQIAPTVMTIHTRWLNPVMNPDGKLDPVKTNDMIVSFVVIRVGDDWKATDVDLHNVEKMDLPFSNPGQH